MEKCTIKASWEELEGFKMTNLERGLSMMELLVENPDGMGISEISRILELPKNFVFRAANVLHLRGYLERNDEAKTFAISRKLLSMGYSVLQQTSLIEIAMPHMRQLRDQIKETVTICAIEGTQGIVLDHVPSPHAMRLVVETGAHFNLHSSAPGKAMLAFLGTEDRDAMIESLSFERFTETTITDKEAFAQELNRISEQGYAVDYGEELEGIHCVSAPIFDERNQVIAAIVITGPTLRVTSEMLSDCGERIREAAQQISTKLGKLDESPAAIILDE